MSTEYTEQAAVRRTTTRTARSVAADAVVAVLVGVLLVVVAAIVLLRADYTDGLDGSTVRVLGLDHTPLLGVVEAAFGVLLVLGGAARSRSTELTVGVLLAAFGIVLLAEHERLRDNLGTTSAHGAWALGLGLLVTLVAAVAPSMRRTSTVSVADVDDVRATAIDPVDEPYHPLR